MVFLRSKTAIHEAVSRPPSAAVHLGRRLVLRLFGRPQHVPARRRSLPSFRTQGIIYALLASKPVKGEYGRLAFKKGDSRGRLPTSFGTFTQLTSRDGLSLAVAFSTRMHHRPVLVSRRSGRSSYPFTSSRTESSLGSCSGAASFVLRELA